MADDKTTPDLTATTDQANAASEALSRFTDAEFSAAKGLTEISSLSSIADTAFKSLNGTLSQLSKGLSGSGERADQAAARFGLLSSSILGSRKAFESISGIDSSGLTTFSGQISTLIENLERSPAFGTAASLIGGLKNALLSAGAPMQQVNEAAKGGVNTMKAYANAFFTSADNALKLQNATIQLAARTGGLDTLFGAAGNSLEHMNDLLAAQTAAMSDTMKATGISEDAVEKFYMSLGQVPKALQSTVSSSTAAGTSMSMLTATIKLAHGTGRDFNSVVEDLHQSFKDYGLVGENALKFTARFSELSNKFGVELKDMRDGLMGAAGAFKNIADAIGGAAKMTEAAAKIMNEYIGGLKSSGMTGAHAIETIRGMTDAMAGMRVEQKAFLSAQSGGPGGLMGAFQIEKMMREGKIDEVFDKVRQTMQKQFGKIVTLDEAAKSPTAAAQLEKQMLLLQKGPLGAMVKSDQDAYRVLETFRAKQEGKVATAALATGEQKGSLQDAINKGTTIEEKSYTTLTSMNNHLAALRKAGEAVNLGTAQRALAAGIGTTAGGDLMGAEKSKSKYLTGEMAKGAKTSGLRIESYAQSLLSGDVAKNMTADIIKGSVDDLQLWFKNLPEMVKAPLQTIKTAILNKDSKKIESELEALNADIARRKEEIKKAKGTEKDKLQLQLDEETKKAGAMYAWAIKTGAVERKTETPGMPGLPPKFTPKFSNLDEAAFGEPLSPGKTVGAAAKGVPAKGGGTGGGAGTPGKPAGGGGITPEVYVSGDGTSGRIKVDVVVKVNEMGQSGAINPAPGPS